MNRDVHGYEPCALPIEIQNLIFVSCCSGTGWDPVRKSPRPSICTRPLLPGSSSAPLRTPGTQASCSDRGSPGICPCISSKVSAACFCRFLSYITSKRGVRDGIEPPSEGKSVKTSDRPSRTVFVLPSGTCRDRTGQGLTLSRMTGRPWLKTCRAVFPRCQLWIGGDKGYLMARMRMVPAGGANRTRTGESCLEGSCVTATPLRRMTARLPFPAGGPFPTVS